MAEFKSRNGLWQSSNQEMDYGRVQNLDEVVHVSFSTNAL